MQLQRTRSPTICSLQAGDPGKPMVVPVQVWRLRVRTGSVDVQGQEKTVIPGRVGICPCLFVLFRTSMDWMKPTALGRGDRSLKFKQIWGPSSKAG